MREVELIWPVENHGYDCVQGHMSIRGSISLDNPACAFITSVRDLAPFDPGDEMPIRGYKPLTSVAGLYRTLGSLDPDDSASIVKFANKHGLLSGTFNRQGLICGALVEDFQPTNDSGIPEPLRGEKLVHWQDAIRDLKSALTLWDAEKNGKYDDRLRALTEVLGPNYRTSMKYLKAVATLPLEERNNLKLVVRLIVHDLIDTKVRETARPRLAVVSDFGADVTLVPDNLLAAAWLQFAFAFAGRAIDKTCSVCGKPLKTESEGTSGRKTRGDKEYCGSTCRQKAYEQRKRRVRSQELESKGAEYGKA